MRAKCRVADLAAVLIDVVGNDDAYRGVAGELAIDDDDGTDLAAAEADGLRRVLGGRLSGGSDDHGDRLRLEADVAAGLSDGNIGAKRDGVGQGNAGRDHVDVDGAGAGRLIEKAEFGVADGRGSLRVLKHGDAIEGGSGSVVSEEDGMLGAGGKGSGGRCKAGIAGGGGDLDQCVGGGRVVP